MGDKLEKKRELAQAEGGEETIGEKSQKS